MYMALSARATSTWGSSPGRTKANPTDAEVNSSLPAALKGWVMVSQIRSAIATASFWAS